MLVRLILKKRGKRVWAAQLHGPVTTLGRAVGCTVRVPSSQVSRLHCRLRMEDGYVTVEDLESANGTFINGKRVTAVEVVRPGDRLNLGTLSFVVEYDAPAEELMAAEEIEEIEEIPVLEMEDEVEELEVLPDEDAAPVAQPLEEGIDLDEDLIVLKDTSEPQQAEEIELDDFIFDAEDEDEPPKR